MLSENIKALRKQKGYSQEQLADKLNVVRQTVSKWEKGYSVPDADMLEELADIFEVQVGELLGKESISDEKTSALSEVANQLTIFNEYLARRTRTRKRIIKAIIWIFVLFGAVSLIGGIVFGGIKVAHRVTLEETNVKLECSLDGDVYEYSISYSDDHFMEGGDKYPEELDKIIDEMRSQNYESFTDEAEATISEIQDYFTENGGTCKIINEF